MANRKRPEDNRSTEDILREMNELTQSIDSSIADISSEPQREPAQQATQKRGGGAMKSLLNFFVSVEPSEDVSQTEATPAANAGDAQEAAPAPAMRGPELVPHMYRGTFMAFQNCH